MLRRTLASTSSSSLYACFFNSGVIDRVAESGRVSQRSSKRRILLTQASASPLVALPGNSRSVETMFSSGIWNPAVGGPVVDLSGLIIRKTGAARKRIPTEEQ